MSVLGLTVYPAAFTRAAVAAARPGVVVAFSTATATPVGEGQVGCWVDGADEGVGLDVGGGDDEGLETAAGPVPPALGNPPEITMAPITTAATSNTPLTAPVLTVPRLDPSPSWRRHLA